MIREGKKVKGDRKVLEKELEDEVLNEIVPISLEIKRREINIGDNVGRIYGIIKYPNQVEYGWLSKITNIPGTIASINFTPIDNGEFIGNLSSNIVRNRMIVNDTRDELVRQRAEISIEDSEKIMMQIDRDNETVGTINISVLARGNSKKEKDMVSRKVESTIGMLKGKGRVMANLQEQSFNNLSPYNINDETIGNILNRIMPMSSFVGGFPFSSSGYNDKKGYYIGRDRDRGLIILDPWKRGEDRTNSNFVIMGVPGTGKSTAVKHLMISEYMKGTKLIILDPEREYRELCNNLGGDWINAGGGKGGKINPLQIKVSGKDEEDEGSGSLALHMKNLDVFFQLYLAETSDEERAFLKSNLIELYKEFGIEWETDVSKFKNEEFPIMKDLYNRIKSKNKEDKKVEKLELLLKDISVGSDSFLWNGHTTIEAKSNCICLDTFDLQESSDSIKRTQYFNLLTWSWQQMSKDRNEKVLLICDEAYLMIDPKVPQSLVFLRNVSKRARKYEAGIVIISHSVVDFLADEIKAYGQALLDVPCYKIMFGTDGKNLKETKDLYNLTSAEEELLEMKKRGEGLLIIGSKRLYVNFEIPAYKFKYMGSGGG